MKRFGFAILAALLAYLLTGFYVIRGNEKGVVRRFGAALTRADGTVLLKDSGLHYDLPWPWSTVDRVNLHEVRTLTIGTAELEDADGGEFLQSPASTRRSQFLTGDKNVLNLQITVQYRISETAPERFLFASESAERHLRAVVESVAADLVARSGVDFVHPLGLNELRDLLTRRSRELADRQRLGVRVDEVVINSVYPPVQVKAAFLDVSNARADKEQYINEARAYAEQRRAEARAERQAILDEARTYRQRVVERARGRADSFARMIRQFRRSESNGSHSYEQAKQMAMRRMYIDAMEDIFRDVAGKVFLDSGKPVDLTIFRDPNK